MMMSGPLLVSMAEAIRGFKSFMLIRSTVTSTPASFPNSPTSRLNSTSEAGTKLTHSRMLSFVPLGKLGGFCAVTIPGIPPTTAAPVAALAAFRNALRSNAPAPSSGAIGRSLRPGLPVARRAVAASERQAHVVERDAKPDLNFTRGPRSEHRLVRSVKGSHFAGSCDGRIHEDSAAEHGPYW